MSGGAYDYKYKDVDELANMLSPETDKFQPIRKRMGIALREIATQCHDIEWIDSGDYGDEDWPKIEEWLKKHNF